MKKLLIIILLVFVYLTLTVLPYIKPKSITKEKQEEILDALNHAQFKDEYITLITDPEEALDIRIVMIQEAKESIDMSYYIIQTGDTSDKVLSELIKASNRGVKVRVIVDGKIGGLGGSVGKALAQHNIEVYLFNPVNLLKPGNLQAVHHEKYLNVDNKYNLIGGRNIGDRYFLSPKEGLETVSDLDVFIHQNGAVSSFNQSLTKYTNKFLDNAPIKRVKPKDNKVSKKLLTIDNPVSDLKPYIDRSYEANSMVFITNPFQSKDTRPVIPFVFSELAKNSEEIMIQTPYLTAHQDTLDLLNNKDKKITLVTNSVSSSINYPAFSNYYVNKKKFIDAGINIFEYQSTGLQSLHTKAYIFDDYVSIGSFNLDDRSFFINTEKMLLIDSPEIKEELVANLTKELEQTYQVSGKDENIGLDQPHKVSIFKKALMWISGLFSTLFEFLV